MGFGTLHGGASFSGSCQLCVGSGRDSMVDVRLCEGSDMRILYGLLVMGSACTLIAWKAGMWIYGAKDAGSAVVQAS